MEVIFVSAKWQFTILFIDSIIIYSRSPHQHLEHIEEFLRLLKDAGMTSELKKCYFFCECIGYLSHVIAPGKLQVARKTTEAITAVRYPTTVSQMRSFLGLYSKYRRFVPGFAKLVALLNQRLKEGKPLHFELDEEERKAVNELESGLTSPTELDLPGSAGQLTVDSDASDGQLGCVLLKEQDYKQLRPIGYWLRSLCSAERI